ncbi:MAG: right-handed parallel beta-helix repeat-containing protein [Candidatus Bathyarchaeota archaeon]|nr:right-handed parallel beta-helix repeat-containing protein [Candidatus Bathyarchaeota archaeon]
MRFSGRALRRFRKYLSFALTLIVALLVACIIYYQISPRTTIPPSPVKVSDTTKNGRIFRDEIWSGTIIVTGDIYVPEGVTLTIEPGTIVYMTAHNDDQHTGEEHVKDELTWDPESEVWKDLSATKEYTQSHISWSIEGTINAVGTLDKMIIFTSNSSFPAHLDWDHFVIEPKGSGTLKYCIFEWMHAGPALQSTDSAISQCIVRHIFWGGIHAYGASPVIENNLIEDIGHEGIDTLRSSAKIRHNVIKGTRTGGIVTDMQVMMEPHRPSKTTH